MLFHFFYLLGKVGNLKAFKLLIHSGDNLLISFPQARCWSLEIKRRQKEPNQKNRVDEAKI